MYDIRIGVPNRPLRVVYVVAATNADYALATAESAAIEDGLLGKYGFSTPNIAVDYGRSAVDVLLSRPIPVRELLGHVITECGKHSDDYDRPDDLTVNGHYHYANGACDNEPPYANGGPA